VTELVTSAEMQAIERAAMASGAVTGLQLMEAAGRGVVEAVFKEWPDLAAQPSRAAIVCGPGNNGGDGFVIARLLKGWGWDVDVYFFGDPDRLPPDARANYLRWREMGEVTPYSETAFKLPADIWTTDTLLIDALFGTGLVRPVTGFNEVGWVSQVTEWRLPERLRDRHVPGCRIVAVDIPSGLDADSGRVLVSDDPRHEDIRADLTVTFAFAKRGHVLDDGPAICGKLVVCDIGLPKARPERHQTARTIGTPDPGILDKHAGFHKYGHGHALVLAGPSGRTGAARLAARAALRIGAGLVSVGVPTDAMVECASQLTAIMVRQVDGADAFAELLQDPRFTAVCLGPGLGVGQGTRAMVGAALAGGDGMARKVVLDADALTSFADMPAALFEMLHEGVVLTPHDGEFARVFPDLADQLAAPATSGPAYSRMDAALAAAERAGCTVLLKGPDTVIATPGATPRVHAAVYDRAAPWLATAGSGDVLAGLIAGLMARGRSSEQAAGEAAWLHVEAARRVGPGLIAEDLPDALPAILADILGT
jgi:hydroxyethylthiazole kinase-like uncharacterized protein yjeF